MDVQSPVNQDLSTWGVSRVTDMQGMFGATQFNQDLSRWGVTRVINMQEMFSFTPFNQDLSRWDVSSVTNMFGMFRHAQSFNGNIGVGPISSVINMGRMFDNATVFDQDLSAWNVTSVSSTKRLQINGFELLCDAISSPLGQLRTISLLLFIRIGRSLQCRKSILCRSRRHRHSRCNGGCLVLTWLEAYGAINIRLRRSNRTARSRRGGIRIQAARRRAQRRRHVGVFLNQNAFAALTSDGSIVAWGTVIGAEQARPTV